jgi:hypothetical protein
MQRWQIVLIVVLPLMNLLFLLYFLRRSDFGIADSVDPAAEKVLEVSDLEVEWITKQAGYDVILPKVSCSGKIQNTDSRAWQSIEVELEMYDAQDRFLGEVGTYLRAQLQPGQVENFQMVEYVPENVPIEQVARTEFRVTDGSRD